MRPTPANSSPSASTARRAFSASRAAACRAGHRSGRVTLRAEGVGFEPTEPVDPAQRFSRPPHSTTLPPLRRGLRLLRPRAQPDGAGDAGAAQSAVAAGVLREVLLVVRLGVVERAGGSDLGHDLAQSGVVQRRLVAVARSLDRGAL